MGENRSIICIVLFISYTSSQLFTKVMKLTKNKTANSLFRGNSQTLLKDKNRARHRGSTAHVCKGLVMPYIHRLKELVILTRLWDYLRTIFHDLSKRKLPQ